METLIMVGQLLLGLSILVGLHELGHLLTAKLFGMRVEKFSIGFPPKIAGFQWGETEYSIGAIPLGGFVKISGMVDESMDTEQLASEPQPWEFRSKPAWQRLIVMLGGIIVNVITGIIIFVTLVYSNGETYFSRDQVIENGIVAYEYGEAIGLKTGDKVLDVNGQPYQSIGELSSGSALLSENGYYTVDRQGELIKVEIPKGFINSFNSEEAFSKFIAVRLPFEVGAIEPSSGAEQAGITEGDQILAVDGNPITYFDEMQTALRQAKNQSVSLVRRRGAQLDTLTVSVSEEARIGIVITPLLEPVRKAYGFTESLSRGTSRAFGAVIVNAKALGKMFTGEVSTKNVSGPIGMAKIYGNQWDWVKFWSITGLISMILAFMNLLPIPALDGGHVVFLLYEMVSGRAPSDKFLEYAQKVGMVILLGLMVFVIGNDILKLIF
ncbi:MAG: RIP metalloprotease RseP [Algoriphagus sp.]|jgi:regulator of sigma E protease|uniref:RIP metalloprotease RseP n=1 Tax=Algoriphagus sp. TaxID=1872435 RepID=UPI002775FD07|nr:RIP metalloprotease RseP [Algoriphagus sp.]MDP4747880.1 RIP metalloprotease RseP [Algoriphagus sp.]MDP4905085.1 RIP metalloprotease RseP [Algoriphagus sp.]MDP4956906.1 RIP metalloprotease RseP [Algoriphagus sp.]MDP5124396.1 RIP metalloprotease RseP [Algoriphagus sp.]